MRSTAFLSRRAARRTTSVLAGALLVGCAGATSQNSSATPSLLDKLLPKSENASVADEKESCGTPSQCKSALKKMVADPKRSWVGQPQTPVAYSNGTRLFAYRALRTKLTCRELSSALTEVRDASKTLAEPVQGVSSEQLSRTRALNTQVEGELARERTTRCRG
jgi:hypothetical protein